MAHIISGRADLSKRLRKYPSRTDFPAIVTEMTAILCRASNSTLPLSSARTPGIRIKLVISFKADLVLRNDVATASQRHWYLRKAASGQLSLQAAPQAKTWGSE